MYEAGEIKTKYETNCILFAQLFKQMTTTAFVAGRENSYIVSTNITNIASGTTNTTSV